MGGGGGGGAIKNLVLDCCHLLLGLERGREGRCLMFKLPQMALWLSIVVVV